MTDSPGWLAVVPEIRAQKSAADDAVKKLSLALETLRTTPPNADAMVRQQAYSSAVQSWSDLMNQTDRLANLGLALASSYPDQSKYLVTMSVVELADNVLDAAVVLSSSAGDLHDTDPMAYVRQQPKALESAQRLISGSLPDSTEHYRARFEGAGFPVAGFPDAVTATAELVPASAVANLRDSVRILHISDLHRTKDERVSNPEVLRDLLHSIETLKDGPFDLIVMSGDVTQSATLEEYGEAEQFLGALADKLLGGRRERCLLVPGNHDVCWKTTKAGGFIVWKQDPEEEHPDGSGLVTIGGINIQPTPEVIHGGLKSFCDSHQRFFGRKYPSEANERCLYVEIAELDIGVLLIDTVVGTHHLTEAAHVSREALGARLEQAIKSGKKVIAIGHHGPVTRPDQSDALPRWVLERLLDAGVALYLHGHVHKTEVQHFTRDGILHMPCIGVGSLVAGPKQRPESTARYYHVVHYPLVDRRGRVFVRAKETRESAWRPDMRFGPMRNPVDYLDFHVR